MPTLARPHAAFQFFLPVCILRVYHANTCSLPVTFSLPLFILFVPKAGGAWEELVAIDWELEPHFDLFMVAQPQDNLKQKIHEGTLKYEVGLSAVASALPNGGGLLSRVPMPPLSPGNEHINRSVVTKFTCMPEHKHCDALRILSGRRLAGEQSYKVINSTNKTVKKCYDEMLREFCEIMFGFTFVYVRLM